jgi:hypothetical protein
LVVLAAGAETADEQGQAWSFQIWAFTDSIGSKNKKGRAANAA